MPDSFFSDFDGDDAADDFYRESEPYDTYLTVRGLLCTHYGEERGNHIFDLLRRSAQAQTESIEAPTTPGILFSDDDGEFVGFEQDAFESPDLEAEFDD